MLIRLLLILPCFAAGILCGQGFTGAEASAQADLEDAIERLGALRQQIRKERIPLAKELNQLEAEVLQLRREVEQARRIRDSQSIGLEALQAEVEREREAADYLETLFGEYVRNFESRLAVAELPLYETPLSNAKNALDDPASSRQERFAALSAVVQAGLERAHEQLGGMRYTGEVVLPDGMLAEGRYAQVGPLVYVALEDGRAGWTEASASLRPALVAAEAASAAAIRELVATGAGTVPIDVTLGDAQALEATRGSLLDHVAKGGIWIYPILGFALVATLVSLLKLFEIFGFKQPPPGIIHELLELIADGHADKALEQAEAAGGPFGDMLADGVRYHADDRELLEEVLYEHLLRLQPRLERFLPLIAVTAATAPLLGLLGTVTGMINTFNLITVFGSGDARALSSGISEALVTTEFGLIVAIPALIMHALLQRRAQGILAEMEKAAVAFQNGLPKRKTPSNHP